MRAFRVSDLPFGVLEDWRFPHADEESQEQGLGFRPQTSLNGSRLNSKPQIQRT